MKILFITSSSINGGAQKHIRDMFISLTKLGNKIFLAAPNGWLVDELADYRNNIMVVNPSLSNIKRLDSYIRKIQPEVTNTFILSGGCFGTAAWKKSRCGKLFITVNNPVIYDGISAIGKMIYPKLYRWMARYASAFLVKSDTVRDEVSEVIRENKPVISIKNGIDFSVFDKDQDYDDIRDSFGISKDAIVVSNVAVLNERKGQRHIIEAVAALHNKYNIHLLLAGEGPDLENIRLCIEQNHASKVVHVLGRRSDINAILANSDLFVLSSYHEGLPNALMEAMAMALPCIATDVGGVRQLIDDGVSGIVINPKSSDEILYALEYLLENPPIARDYAEKAYNKIVSTYKQDVVANELLGVYTSC